MPSKEAALHDLLLQLFDATELRRFVHFAYGRELVDNLPGASASLSTLAFEITSAMSRRGLVDEALFQRLRDVRPHHHEFIDAVGAVWIVDHKTWRSRPSPLPSPAHERRNSAAIQIFVSYSRKDVSFREDLEVHLRLLQRKGAVDVWHDGRIAAGDEWENVLRAELESADIILFLMSPDFLASDFCWSIELKRALERVESGDTMIVPVLVRPCMWKDSPLAHFQVLPRDATAISRQSDTDAAWLEVAESVREAAAHVRHERG